MEKSTGKLTIGINSMRAKHKLLISMCLFVACVSGFLVTHFELLTAIMIGWNLFCISLISLSVSTIITMPSSMMHAQAKKQDEDHRTIFLVVLAAVCISLVGILFTLISKEESIINKELHTVFSMSGVGLSWLLLHTLFTLHYAHLYYSHKPTEQHPHAGIVFPEGTTHPHYTDFAYFSFVIGMTFQVSDVQVYTRAMRKVVLLHSLISFVFNTIIVALTISTLANITG